MIQDILQKFNVPFVTEGNHHCRPGWIQVDCPFCGEKDKKYHLGLSTGLTGANCWRCGPQNLLRVLHEITGESYSKCKAMLSAADAVFVEEARSGKLVLPKYVERMQSAHKLYLKKRGFDPKALEDDWHISGIGIASMLSWRIFIPIHLGNEIVSWTTRSISDKATLRYISAGKDEESVSKKRLLYGEQYAKHAVVVCEGPMDVWKIGKGAVATLGTGYSLTQVKKIGKYPTRVIVFDNERAAQSRANSLCDLLSVFPGKTFNAVLSSNDPGSASEVEIADLRKFLA